MSVDDVKTWSQNLPKSFKILNDFLTLFTENSIRTTILRISTRNENSKNIYESREFFSESFERCNG